MEKAKKPITTADLLEYLKEASSFAFELETQLVLTKLGFTCEHSGTYNDPLTNKPRQFDVRARGTFEPAGQHLEVRLAVECKRLGCDYPLLVSCVPRSFDESCCYPYFYSRHGGRRCIQLWSSSSLYRQDDPVCKSLEQVKRGEKKDCWVSTNTEIWEKWSQAVASCNDLLPPVSETIPELPKALIVLPVLVIPDGTLWQVDYDQKTGTQTSEPRQVHSADYYLNHKVSGATISHLHIVTSAGLPVLHRRMQEWGYQFFRTNKEVQGLLREPFLHKPPATEEDWEEE